MPNMPLSVFVHNNGVLYAPIFGSATAELAIWNNVPLTNGASGAFGMTVGP